MISATGRDKRRPRCPRLAQHRGHVAQVGVGVADRSRPACRLASGWRAAPWRAAGPPGRCRRRRPCSSGAMRWAISWVFPPACRAAATSRYCRILAGRGQEAHRPDQERALGPRRRRPDAGTHGRSPRRRPWSAREEVVAAEPAVPHPGRVRCAHVKPGRRRPPRLAGAIIPRPGLGLGRPAVLTSDRRPGTVVTCSASEARLRNISQILPHARKGVSRFRLAPRFAPRRRRCARRWRSGPPGRAGPAGP